MENKLTPHEYMLETVRLLERRKKTREKAKREADGHSIDNLYRVRKKQYYSRQNKISRY